MAKSIEELMAENNNLQKQVLSALSGGGTSGLGGGTKSPSSSGIPNLGTIFQPLNTATNSLVGGFDSLYRGTLNTSSALGAMSGVIKELPIAGGVLGNALQKTGQAVIDTNTNLNQNTKVGANFNNNISQYAELVGGARLTQDQYNQILKENVTSLNGLGSTVNRSQSNFLNFTRGLNESNVVAKMKELGLSAEEVAAAGTASLANRKGLDLSSASAQREAINAAIDLAATMEQNTRITGISRDEQIKDIEKRSHDARVQATVMGMDPAAQDRFKKTMATLETLGPGVQDFATEVFTGGIRTKEGSAKLAALGTAGTELEQATKLQKNAVTAEQQQQAAAAMARATAHVNERMASEDFRNMVRFNNGAVGDAARSLMEQNNALGPALAAQKEALTSGGSADLSSVMKKQKEEVTNEMRGRAADGSKITNAGTEMGRTINKMDRALSDQTAGVTKNFGQLVDSTNSLVKSENLLNEALKPRTQAETSSGQSELVNKLLTGKPSITETPVKTKRTAAEIAAPVEREQGSPGVKEFLSGAGFDKMFENFGSGTPAVLHGQEAVIRKDQFEQMRTQIQNEMSSMIPTNMEPIELPTDEIKDQFTSTFEKFELPETSDIFTNINEMFMDVGNEFSSLSKNIVDSNPVKSISDVFNGDSKEKLYKSLGLDSESIKKHQEVNEKNKNDGSFQSLLAQIKEPNTNKTVNTASAFKEPEPEKQLETKKQVEQPIFSTPGANNITLKEINDQLILLNKSIGTLILNTSEAVSLSSKQVKATKGLSGNRIA